MNLKQLYDVVERDMIMCELTHRNPESIKVCIPIQTTGMCAGTSTIDVKWANKGFDWDDHKFVVYPIEDLSLTDPNDFDKLKDMRDKLEWKEYDNKELKRQIKKMQKFIDDLDSGEYK